MRKSIFVGMTTTLAMSLFVVAATTTGSLNILPANADPDEKSERWGSDNFSVEIGCAKDPSCKQVNEETRDLCDEASDTDSKCKNMSD